MIFDTNALSAYAEGDPALKEVIRFSKGFYLPVMVLGEYRYGLMSSREKQARQEWLKTITGFFGILAVTEETSHNYAEIRHALKKAGTPIPENDIWIAALSQQHALPLLTKDQHFKQIAGLKLISW